MVLVCRTTVNKPLTEGFTDTVAGKVFDLDFSGLEQTGNFLNAFWLFTGAGFSKRLSPNSGRE
jgi:hypothetical protein